MKQERKKRPHADNEDHYHYYCLYYSSLVDLYWTVHSSIHSTLKTSVAATHGINKWNKNTLEGRPLKHVTFTVPSATQPLLEQRKRVKKMPTETWECWSAVEVKAVKTKLAGGLRVTISSLLQSCTKNPPLPPTHTHTKISIKITWIQSRKKSKIETSQF